MKKYYGEPKTVESGVLQILRDYPQARYDDMILVMHYGDLRCNAVHHDGTNHYLYRVIKDGVSETQVANLQEKLYRGIATRADIVRVTKRLGDEIAKVYGFDIPKPRQKIQMER